MACWLLHGPTQVTGVGAGNGDVIGYFPEVGLFWNTYDGFGILSFDGVFAPWHWHVGHNLSYVGWWATKKKFVIWGSGSGGGTFEYQMEPRAFYVQKTGPYPINDQMYGDGPQFWWASSRYVKLADKRVYFSNGHYRMDNTVSPPEQVYEPGGVHAVYFEDARDRQEGPPYSDFLFPGGANAFPGRSETEIFLSDHVSGVFYDTELKVITSRHYWTDLPGYQPRWMQYCPEFDVLVSIHGKDGQMFISVWALEPRPTQVGDITVIAGGTGGIRSGQVITFQTRVTGDIPQSYLNHWNTTTLRDPCPDELVNWALSGSGTLLDMQTKTNKDGYATARVQYAVGEAGSTELEASIQC